MHYTLCRRNSRFLFDNLDFSENQEFLKNLEKWDLCIRHKEQKRPPRLVSDIPGVT